MSSRSTPSRVTRSSSRQPERSPARAGSSSKKKKAAAASPARSQKKSSSSSSSNKKSDSSSSRKSGGASTPSSSAKKSVSNAARSAAIDASEALSRASESASRASGKARALADQVVSRVRSEVEHVSETVERVERRVSSVTGGHSRRNSSANGSSRAQVLASAPDSDSLPYIALLPQIAIYTALVTLAHTLVLFAFGKESLQLETADFFSRASFHLVSVDTIKHALIVSRKEHIGFWAVVPLYLAAGMFLRAGVRHVLASAGSQGRAAALAANIARVISAIAFIGTVVAYTEWDRVNSYEGLNALVVLEFAFMLQEFLLNFRRFTGARQLYSLVYLALTGYFSFHAYNFHATTSTPSSAPPLIVALNYALLVVNTSDNLAAASGVAWGMGARIVANVFSALQGVVNFAVLPVMAVSIFQHHSTLFPQHAQRAQPTFAESAQAAALMTAGVFLLVVDGFMVPFTRVQVGGARQQQQIKTH